MRKNYNFLRKRMYLPEYGRHIHEMVDSLLEIEDRDQRNKQARAVIAVMGNLFPALRDTPNIAHKLWDHLFIMSDFKLDVDSPYPIPTAVTLAPVPDRIPYPKNHIALKHYGGNVRKIIRELSLSQEKDAVAVALGNIARFMRTKSYEYNQEHPDNSVIIKDIRNMAAGSIEIDEDAINNIKSDYKQSSLSYQKKSNPRQKNGKIVKNQSKGALSTPGKVRFKPKNG